jgi:hypothetical protein
MQGVVLLFYVTFSVVDWLPIFVSEAACKIVTERRNFCHRQACGSMPM